MVGEGKEGDKGLRDEGRLASWVYEYGIDGDEFFARGGTKVQYLTHNNFRSYLLGPGSQSLYNADLSNARTPISKSKKHNSICSKTIERDRHVL